jgi:flagellar M-ring protein FliF
MRPLITRMFTPVSAMPTPSMQYSPAQITSGEAQSAQAPTGQIALPATKESMIDVSRIEGQVRESSIRKVGEVVQAHPEEALAILRTWLHEPA